MVAALYTISAATPSKPAAWSSARSSTRVSGIVTYDPAFGTDILTSAILEYPSGHAIFTCSTQIAGQQKMCFYGTEGRIEPAIPIQRRPGCGDSSGDR